jgi:hypothetical protein
MITSPEILERDGDGDRRAYYSHRAGRGRWNKSDVKIKTAAVHSDNPQSGIEHGQPHEALVPKLPVRSWCRRNATSKRRETMFHAGGMASEREIPERGKPIGKYPR